MSALRHVATFAALTFGFIAVAAPAHADEPSPRFPEIGFEWYVTAPAFSGYDVTSAPAPRIDESMKESGLVVTYYKPTGSGPGPEEADIQIRATQPFDVVPASDRIDIDLASFGQLEVDLNARLIDGILLPTPTVVDAGSATVISKPTIAWNGSVLSVIRPAMHERCSASDVQDFSLQLAILGDNNAKYLTTVDVSFGQRSKAAQDEHEARCSSGPETPSPTPSSVEDQSETARSATASPTTMSPAEINASSDSGDEHEVKPLYIIAAFAIVVIGFIVIAVRRFKRGRLDVDGEGHILNKPIRNSTTWGDGSTGSDSRSANNEGSNNE